MRVDPRYVGCVVVAALLAGCASSPLAGKRMARYQPNLSGLDLRTKPEEAKVSSAEEPARERRVRLPLRLGPGRRTVGEATAREQPVDTPEPAEERRLKRGDKVFISLLGIPPPEAKTYEDFVDGQGKVRLPHIGSVRIEGMTTAEAEEHIQQLYTVTHGIYKSISVTVNSQFDEFFIRGEVMKQGRIQYPSGLTLLKAITLAGGYTPFANRKKIKIIRGEEVLRFNAERIELRKDPDPVIRRGDLIIVPRRFV
jgi:polysaccharide export outer membrane protein